MAMPMPLTMQIACIERELRMRRRVYPRWVEAGRITQAKAEWEIDAMEGVLATLQALLPPPAQGSIL